MAPRTVLYVAHNHPAQRPGGAETYALELHAAMRHSEEFRPVLLAKTGPPVRRAASRPVGPRLFQVDGESDSYLLHTDAADFDPVMGTLRDKRFYTQVVRDFLLTVSPDVVHFQHTLYLGYDMVRIVKTVLPDVPVVYTLHDFLPICHHNGQMVRKFDMSLCDRSSPERCHACFPGIAADRFLLRERFAKAQLSYVDRFIAPSRTVLDRYLAWGIPEDRLLLEDYGRAEAPAAAPPGGEAGAGPAGRPRNRLGFIGQLTRFKGVDVLLEALLLLRRDGVEVELEINGANLDSQPVAFRERIAGLIEQAGPAVRVAGAYDRSELPRRLARVDWVVVPSLWWENSPLVIQEAFMHGRPVICSGIGGMAEKVRDGVDGLHFAVGDPEDLAAVVRRAVSAPGLWERLRNGIDPPHSMEDHVATLSALYGRLLAREPSVA